MQRVEAEHEADGDDDGQAGAGTEGGESWSGGRMWYSLGKITILTEQLQYFLGSIAILGLK